MIYLKSIKIRSFGITSKDSDITAKKAALNIAKTLQKAGFNIKIISPLVSSAYPIISLTDNKNMLWKTIQNNHCFEKKH